MIDPKLNEIPVAGRTAAEAPLTDAEKAERLRLSRSGLSINDTIAGDTILSSGSRGVDTSGVSAGSGAAAGLSITTPGTDESPAPNLVPGSRGSGTTVRAGANPTHLAGSPTSDTSESSGLSTSGVSQAPNTRDVADRAYQIWFSRGCPAGTAEEDWHQAERELRSEANRTFSKAATI